MPSGQTSFSFGASRAGGTSGASRAAGRAVDTRSIETTTRAVQLTQELRRPRPEAPRLAQREDADAAGAADRLRLERRILAHLPTAPIGRLDLAITDNRYTMIAVRREKGPVYRVRLHHMFFDAPPSVTRALARYIAWNDRTASRELGRYIDDNQAQIRRARRKAPVVALQTRGEVHDLREVFDHLNRRYFEGRIDAQITWGPRGSRRRRRTSIKMGSYSVEDRLIRIHPSLDRAFVPLFFLEWIVFHEMLHQVFDIPVVDGRRQFHTPQFLLAERTYEHYAKARDWEHRNLDRLLSY